MKTPNPDAETNESILISGVNQLNPKKKTGVEPHADNNVLNVTNHCLYALTSTDRESTGRTSGAWWFIWMNTPKCAHGTPMVIIQPLRILSLLAMASAIKCT